MARPLRIEYPGAVYHVTSRGNRHEPIARDDVDRVAFLTILGQAFERFDAHAWAYCLMGNHYHLVIRTRQANLSRLMRHINGVYTQAFNRRHQLAGHLFQGRFKAILVDRDNYLLEVCRYVDLNPVRAKMVESPEAYPWSSYRALSRLADKPHWLDAASVYAQLAPGSSNAQAAAQYAQFVAQGHGTMLWEAHLRQQIYLGNDDFVNRMQQRAGLDTEGNADHSASEQGASAESSIEKSSQRKANVSRIQSSAPALHGYLKHLADLVCSTKAERNQHIVNAFYQGGHTQTAIAQAFDLSASAVSRVIKEHENAGRK